MSLSGPWQFKEPPSHPWPSLEISCCTQPWCNWQFPSRLASGSYSKVRSFQDLPSSWKASSGATGASCAKPQQTVDSVPARGVLPWQRSQVGLHFRYTNHTLSRHGEGLWKGRTAQQPDTAHPAAAKSLLQPQPKNQPFRQHRATLSLLPG